MASTKSNKKTPTTKTTMKSSKGKAVQSTSVVSYTPLPGITSDEIYVQNNRLNNVIIKGICEDLYVSRRTNMRSVLPYIQNIFNTITHPEVVRIKRALFLKHNDWIGNIPICVILNHRDDVQLLLDNRRRLASIHHRYPNLWLKRDLIAKYRHYFKDVYEEVERRRSNGERVGISYIQEFPIIVEK